MSKLPISVNQGILKIGESELSCAVLNDGTRVLSQNAVLKAFGRKKRGRYNDDTRVANMPSFLDAKNLQPLIDSELRDAINEVKYINEKNKEVTGYKAQIIPLICNLYLEARNQKVLLKQQLPLAMVSEILVRTLSKIGIIALVDEATGYQDTRPKDALRLFLEKFLLDEKAKWVKTFPDEFFEMIFKMKNWTWSYASTKKPQVVGHYINDIVYSRIGPKVLSELRERNPKNEKGNRKAKHPQYLSTDYGHPKLKEHLSAVVALGRASGHNWNNFHRLLNRAFPKFGDTMEIGFEDNSIEEDQRKR